MNALKDNDFTRSLKSIREFYPNPKAILCISAHWMTEGSWVTHMERPNSRFFPQALFHSISSARIASPRVHADDEMWGLDHGTWSVLKHIFPEAKVTVFSLASICLSHPNIITSLALKSVGGVADYMVHDVASDESWKRVAEKAQTALSKIDVLVNNAGILGNIMAPIEERTVEEFNKVIAVNLLGQFLGVKTVVPYMRKAGGGSIVNISSIGGITGSSGTTAYTASKGGSRIFTKGAAGEFAKDNIRVNSVHPGYVETPMTTGMKAAKKFRDMAVGLTPLGRGAKLEEMAYGVLFLASDESSFMTGSGLVIDGGNTAI